MLNEDYSTKLLDMEHMKITNIDLCKDKMVIHVEMERRETVCPSCGAVTDAIHDYRTQTVKDCPVQGRPVMWEYKKRRYRCPCCGKRFYENNWLLPKWHRITNRLALSAVQKLSTKISRKDIAIECNVSQSTIARWMHLTKFSRPDKLPTVLSIDEFKGNTDGEKFQCILTDPKGKRILDILPSRKESEIYDYLHDFSNRKDVKYFVCDMQKSYVRIAKLLFPNATIVIDKFHVSRYCTWALENVRKRVQKRLLPEDRKYFKRSRTLLIKHMDKLDDYDREALERMLLVHVDLRNAYLLKEKFFEFMASKDGDEATVRLKQFMLYARVVNLPEFDPLVKVLLNWTKYILNSFGCKYTNGFTEGCNNKIKVLKRIAFGYRSFENLRQRILLTQNAVSPTPRGA